MIFFGRRVPIRIGMIVAGVLVFLCLLGIPMLGFLGVHKYPEFGLPMTYGLLIILGICNAVIRQFYSQI
jgi:hypothetical protein